MKDLPTILTILAFSFFSFFVAREIPKFSPSENNDKGKIWKRVAIADRSKLWEEGVVPYEIGSNCSESLQRTIHLAMRGWESKTCIKFVPAQPYHQYKLIILNEGPCGCCSSVGKVQKNQEAYFHEACNAVPTIMHELGHAIGFHHEQNRPDRNKYVRILFENIQKGHENNFVKLRKDEADTLGFGYDFDSIMHYEPQAFGIGGKDSIQLLNKNFSVLHGYNRKLSDTDIAATKKLYHCPKCYFTTNQKIGHILLSEESLARKEGYCEWFINRNPGEFLEFYVKDLDIPGNINCSTDYLQIQDGYWSKSPVIEKMCGKRNSAKYYLTKSSQLRITYKSSSRESEGSNFYVQYRVLCNGTIKGHEGEIQSPVFDQNYLYDSVCQWVIVVPVGYKVALSFRTFRMSYNSNCDSDYVEVLDGGILSNKLISRFCINKNPDDILSTTEFLTVRFVSKNRNFGSHFLATFTKEINECERPDNGCVGRCVNTYGSYYCECDGGKFWFNKTKCCEKFVNSCGGLLHVSEKTVITSPFFPNLYPSNIRCIWKILNRSVTLKFLHMDIEVYSNYCYDKLIIRGERFRKEYCGKEIPNSLVIPQTFGLEVQFISDNINGRSGFALLVEPF